MAWYVLLGYPLVAGSEAGHCFCLICQDPGCSSDFPTTTPLWDSGQKSLLVQDGGCIHQKQTRLRSWVPVAPLAMVANHSHVQRNHKASKRRLQGISSHHKWSSTIYSMINGWSTFQFNDKWMESIGFHIVPSHNIIHLSSTYHWIPFIVPTDHPWIHWRLEEMNQANRHAPRSRQSVRPGRPCGPRSVVHGSPAVHGDSVRDSSIKSYGWDFTTQNIAMIMITMW